MISELMNRHAKLMLCLFTAFLALLYCVNTDGYADYKDITGHFNFTVDDSGCATITGGDSANIPATVSFYEYGSVHSYPVTQIGNFAFYECSGLTGKLKIPSGVTTIGDYAFSYCSGLTGYFTIPDSVTEIGRYAFYECSGLTGSLGIPNGVTEIEAYTFYGCSGLTGRLGIPSSVTKIESSAFACCTGLIGELAIPDSVTEIGFGAFQCCESLTGNLTISNSVTKIEDYVFSGCVGLTGALTIPEGVTEIGEGAFSFCRGLTGNLTIPNSVTKIGISAFYGCRGLTGMLTIPNSVTTIGDYAFSFCSGLEHIYFQGDAPTIAADAFAECTLYGHYPKDNETWTSDKLQDYGGKISWASFTRELTLSGYKSDIPSSNYYYRGTSVVPEYSQNIKIYCYETDELLVQDRDYTVEYSDPVNVGMCKVTVRGINGYDGINGEPSGSLYAGDGSLQGSFIIKPRNLTDMAIITLCGDLNDGEYLYTGEAVCPEITITCFMDDDLANYEMTDWPYLEKQILTKDKDYTVSYSSNTAPGTATVTVEGIGNFCSTVTEEFRILPTMKIPSTVTEIQSQAFYSTAAEAFVIPETCKSVAADAFDNCLNLKYIVNNSNVDISADYEGSSVMVISNGDNQ